MKHSQIRTPKTAFLALFSMLFLALFATLALGATEPKLKNVILLIGDGMGPEQVRSAGLYLNGEAGSLYFETLPNKGSVTTHNADMEVTDSAAAATAMATGRKVKNGVLSMAVPGNGAPLATILELAQKHNMRTGLVTTTYMVHATPAGFASHDQSRNESASIGEQMLKVRPNVLMGGAYGPDATSGFTTTTAAAAGYTVVADRASMQAVDTNATSYLAGAFGWNHMPYETDGIGALPHLSEMAATTLDVLDNDANGFFLMIEGGRIDHACHAHELEHAVGETIEFANTVRVVHEWAKARPDVDTLIVVTADHETGGLQVAKDNGKGNLPDVTWSTGGHTGADVPLFAWGLSAERYVGKIDNTDIFANIGDARGILARTTALGWESFADTAPTMACGEALLPCAAIRLARAY